MENTLQNIPIFIMMIAAFYSHGQAVIHYLIIFGVIMANGMLNDSILSKNHS